MCLGAVVQGRGKWVAGGGQLGLRVRSSWALLLDASQWQPSAASRPVNVQSCCHTASEKPGRKRRLSLGGSRIRGFPVAQTARRAAGEMSCVVFRSEWVLGTSGLGCPVRGSDV